MHNRFLYLIVSLLLLVGHFLIPQKVNSKNTILVTAYVPEIITCNIENDVPNCYGNTGHNYYISVSNRVFIGTVLF